MMRPVLLAMPPVAPDPAFDGTTITWADASVAETAYAVEKLVSGVWTEVWRLDRVLAAPNTTGEPLSFTAPDAWVTGDQYRVVAENKVGDAWNYADPGLNEIVSGGFPTVTAKSYAPITIPEITVP